MSPISFIRLGTLCLALVGSPILAEEPTLAGHWNGTVELPGQELEFEVDLTESASGWTGFISIPAQGAKNLPLDAIEVGGRQVSFVIGGIPGEPTFSGELGDGELSGDFTQAGQTFPFRMKAGDDFAKRARAALEGIDEVIGGVPAQFDIPGMAVAVVADGEVVLARGYGLRDVEEKLPVDEDTLFAIGSTSKAFTAFVLGTLVDEGKLDWDTPLIEYLPDFRLYDDHATKRLKVRDLLIHTSGLPRHDLVWYNNLEATRESLFRSLAYLEPTRDLGEEFQYQNLMFMTAGYLAERITGQGWEELVEERIFAPLGMKRSNFSVEESRNDPDHAEPYLVEDQEARHIPFRNIDVIGPAGSINSSVAEMTQWLRMQLAGGEIDGKRLIEEGTLREMHTPQNAIASYPSDQNVLPLGYGFGWSIDSYQGRYMVSHGGGIDGFISWVAMLPLERLGVVVYTNGSGANPVPTVVARTVIDRVLGLEGVDWVERAREQFEEAQKSQTEAEANKEARRKQGTSPSHPIADYAGEYEHPGYGIVTVELLAGDALRADYHGMPADLEHWHFDTFNGQTVGEGDPSLEDTKFHFRTDVDGEITELLLPFEPNVDPILFTRMADRRLSDPAYLERFTGSYEMSDQTARVSLAGDELSVHVEGQATFRLLPKQGTEFALQGMKGFILEFVLEGEKVTGARFHQPNGTFDARRVE